MANFTNNSIKDTYERILQVGASGVVQDGTGSANLGSLNLSSSLSVTGSVTVTGALTANSLTVNALTQSSTLFSSGSSQFGDSLDDNHNFTGSVKISGSITADRFIGLLSSSAQISTEISGAFTTTSSSMASQLTSINSVTSSYVSHSASIVDLPGKKIQYSNVYTNFSDLPAASTYHGMFAHVHNTGSAYFAHGGNWVQLANSSSFATDVGSLLAFSSSLDSTYATDAQVTTAVNTATASLSGSLATDIATNLSSITTNSSSVASDVASNVANHTALDTKVNGILGETGSYFKESSISGSVVGTGVSNTFTNTNFFNRNVFYSSSLYPLHTEIRGNDIRFLSTSQATVYGEIGFDSSSLGNQSRNLVQVIAYPAADELHLINASGSTSVGIEIDKTSSTSTGEFIISSSQLLTIQPSDPLPSNPSTGSLAVTGSTLAFYNGNNWLEISGSIIG